MFAGGEVTKIEQVQTKGGGGESSKVWSFCDNVIIECNPVSSLIKTTHFNFSSFKLILLSFVLIFFVSRFEFFFFCMTFLLN